MDLAEEWTEFRWQAEEPSFNHLSHTHETLIKAFGNLGFWFDISGTGQRMWGFGLGRGMFWQWNGLSSGLGWVRSHDSG